MITEKERAALWAAIGTFIIESGGGDDTKTRIAARRDVERVVEDICARALDVVMLAYGEHEHNGRDMLSPCACQDTQRLVNFRTGEVVCGGCGNTTKAQP